MWCHWSQIQQDISGPDTFRSMGCLWTIPIIDVPVNEIEPICVTFLSRFPFRAKTVRIPLRINIERCWRKEGCNLVEHLDEPAMNRRIYGFFYQLNFSKLLGQGYNRERLKTSLRKFCGWYMDLIKQYEVPFSQMFHYILGHDHMQWYPPLIKFHTNLWPCYHTWPITEFGFVFNC